jgi:hypothetical protein
MILLSGSSRVKAGGGFGSFNSTKGEGSEDKEIFCGFYTDFFIAYGCECDVLPG